MGKGKRYLNLKLKKGREMLNLEKRKKRLNLRGKMIKRKGERDYICREKGMRFNLKGREIKYAEIKGMRSSI